MKKSIAMLIAGIESACYDTPEFIAFVAAFTREFTKELKSVGATDIQFRKGHFSVSGFYTIGTQAWYFSLSDVRGAFPISGINGIPVMYRTCKDYADYTGGRNQWVAMGTGMAMGMHG